MKKILLLVLIILLSNPFFAQKKPLKLQNHILKTALTALKNDKDLKNAAISFLAVDLKTDETIAELNPDMGMIPASTQKLFTTAAALELAEADYRFKTEIQYTGTIDKASKTLKGDIIIKGGGDPTLGSKYFYKNRQFDFIKEIIAALKSAGINALTGKVIADASIYAYESASPKWLWEEVANYYAIAANGLTIHDNLYELHFKSPQEPGKATQITKIYPEIPNLKIQNEVLSSNIRSDEAYIYGAPYTYKRIVRGTIPKNKADFIVKGAIPDPACFFAWYLSQALDSAGIRIGKAPTTVRLMQLKGKKITAGRSTIKTLYSPSLFEIIKLTNHKSNNLYAEHLLNLIAVKRSLKIKSQQAAAEELINFWQEKGMDTDGLHIFDGSGLSRLNSISAKQFIFLLKYMKTQSKYSHKFLESLPVSARSGTLKYFGRGTALAGNMQAKSGSVERVRAYAGYIRTKSGRNVAFSINIANYNCSSKAVRQKIAAVLKALADFSL